MFEVINLILDEIIFDLINLKYIHENKELILRSIDKAQIINNSYEYNICEFCGSCNDYQDCGWCKRDLDFNSFVELNFIPIMPNINYYGD